MKLKSYSGAKRRKGVFDEVVESIRHGASGNGVGRMLGVSASTVGEGWKARSKELPDEFRGRDLSGIDGVAMMVDGIFPGKESCVVVALAIDSEGHKHLLDFEGGSRESAEAAAWDTGHSSAQCSGDARRDFFERQPHRERDAQLARDARQGVSLEPVDRPVDAVDGSGVAAGAGGLPASPGA